MEKEVKINSVGPTSVLQNIDMAQVQLLNDIVASTDLHMQKVVYDSYVNEEIKKIFCTIEENLNVNSEIYKTVALTKERTAAEHITMGGFTIFIAVFVSHDLDINTPLDSNQHTLLHFAADRNNITLVYFLVTQNANIEVTDLNKRTALHLAAANGSMELVKLLLSWNSDIHARDIDWRSPLYYAVKNSHVTLIQYFLSSGADINVKDIHNKSLLHVAARTDNTEIMKLLLDRGLYVNDKDYNHCTPLHEAVSSGQSRSLRFFIMNGADVNYVSEFNISPLHSAVLHNNNYFVHILLDFGADPKKEVFHNGQTLLHWACATGDVALVERLIMEHFFDIYAKDNFGKTPASVAVEYKRHKVIECIMNFVEELIGRG